ncbi:MAG TPA: IS4 family transposase [Polyangiaceae bacterium]|nr:IS4 family transposase [Polyangiaceae bacterium]
MRTQPSRPLLLFDAPAPCVKLLEALPRAAVEQAVGACGRVQKRWRRLPAVLVVYLVVAAALLRHVALARLVPLLGLSVPRAGRFAVAVSALTAARKRLGPEPLRALLSAVAAPEARRWRGRRLLGLDGTSLRAPDSRANREWFGLHRARLGESAYPLLRLVLLVELGTRHVLDAAVAPFDVGEPSLARRLLGALPPDALVLLDGGYVGGPFVQALLGLGAGRAFLLPLPSNATYRVLARLGPGDELGEFRLTWRTRRRHPQAAPTWTARVIRYHARGWRPRRFVTNLLEPAEAPRAELGALYRERWELELGLGDAKAHLLERQEALRSRTPRLCEQEVYALLVANNVLRALGAAHARALGVEPRRVSFVGLRDALRAAWVRASAPVEGALDEVSGGPLPLRREGRRCPREVKLGRSRYAPKRLRRTAPERWMWEQSVGRERPKEAA